MSGGGGTRETPGKIATEGSSLKEKKCIEFQRDLLKTDERGDG